METRASIVLIPESDAFLTGRIVDGSLLNSFFQGAWLVRKNLFNKLPLEMESWFHTQFSRRWAFTGWFVAFILGLVISGIVEGEVFDFWKGSILPWLIKNHSFSNGIILLIGVGWILCIVSILFLFGIYGAGRQRIGLLEAVQQQNTTLGQKTTELNVRLSELTRELTQRTDETAQLQNALLQETSDRDRLHTEVKLLDLILNTDRELFIMFTQFPLSEEVMQNSIEAIFRRTFELWGLEKVHRGAIYTPDPKDTDFLTIRWDYGVGQASRHWDRWYIGEHDPAAKNVYRGIAGNVYIKGEGRVDVDTAKDPDFVELHQPKRVTFPYRSALHTVIHPDDEKKKLGVLCLDSMDYVFTQHDLTLVKQVAARIGWLMQTAQTT